MTSDQVTTLSVLTEKRSGLLSLVVRGLVKQGHMPQGQTMSDADVPGHTLLSFFFEGDITLLPDDLSALKAIHPAIREIKIEHPRATSLLTKKFGQGKAIPEAEFFAFLGKYYPDIVPLVNEYKKRLDSRWRGKTIRSLGKNFGIREYRSKYARGNPLELELAMKRMLQPALSRVLPVEVDGKQVSLPDCPFCREYVSTQDTQCHFAGGFIQGFLGENPKVGSCELQQTHSVARGDNACSFKLA